MEVNKLEDFKFNIKIKLSALWTSVTLCYLYGDYFELYVPKKVEGLVSGVNMLDSPLKLFIASLLLAIPAVMVFLSIVLKPSLNRWLNIVFGIFFTLFVALVGVSSISPWRAFYVFLAIIEVLITSTIVAYAWNWPKQKNQSL
jgi:hypothetical protein